MSSLLDSRSSGMFAVDTRTGVVTTQARLDRERLDVHYFRVVAQDDTFPPRSGTTTLQVNSLFSLVNKTDYIIYVYTYISIFT